jgi:hypothetical protein
MMKALESEIATATETNSTMRTYLASQNRVIQTLKRSNYNLSKQKAQLSLQLAKYKSAARTSLNRQMNPDPKEEEKKMSKLLVETLMVVLKSY